MAKQSAFGTRLRFVDPADSSINRIYHVADISGPEVSASTVDVTTHDSPDQFAEFVAGSAEAGEVTFDLMFDGAIAQHDRLIDLMVARDILEFSLILPSAATEFLAEPDFDSVAGNWTGTGDWSAADNSVVYSSVDPGATETLTAAVTGLLIGESYVVAITFVGTHTGTATMDVKLGATTLGTIFPASGGTQYVRFTAAAASGNLIISVPSSIAGAYEFGLSRVSLTGPAEPTGGFWEFDGLITKCGTQYPVDGAMTAAIAVKVSGKPVFTR